MAKVRISEARIPSPGTHIAKINYEAEYVTPLSGRSFITIPLVIVSGDDAGIEIRDLLNLPSCAKTPRGAEFARKKIKNLLKAIGELEITDDGEFVVDTDVFLGKVVRIKVSHREYEGETQVQIDDYFDASDVAEEFMNVFDREDNNIPF